MIVLGVDVISQTTLVGIVIQIWIPKCAGKPAGIVQGDANNT